MPASSLQDGSGPSSSFDKPKQQRPSGLPKSSFVSTQRASHPRPSYTGTSRSATVSPEEENHLDESESKSSAPENETAQSAVHANSNNQIRQEMAFNLKQDVAREGNIGLSGNTRPSRKERFSPILEEDSAGRSPRLEESVISPLTGMETASTESTKTIKWSGVAQSPGGNYATTPSYPFPPMTMDSGTPTSIMTPDLHRPFTALSPTTTPFQGRAVESHRSRDRGTLDFTMSHSRKDFSLPGNQTSEAPDLFEVTLKLQSEPGLERWWANVAQIMRDTFMASRVTLAVPADSTDVENVPWAQMATFNVASDDLLSSGTTKDLQSAHSNLSDSNGQEELNSEASPKSRENNVEPSSLYWADASAKQSRPKLESRHSFAGFSLRTESTIHDARKNSSANLQRPVPSRANSNLSMRGGLSLGQEMFQGTKLSSQSLQQHLAREAENGPQSIDAAEAQDHVHRARILPVLQTLEMEPDPLLDSAGAVRVLEKGKLVHITRDYYGHLQSADYGMMSSMDGRYEQRTSWPIPESKSGSAGAQKPERSPSVIGSKPSKRPRSQTSGSSISTSGSVSARDEVAEKASYVPPYEDYEQIPVSPWSQSPAPSPAVQADPEVNPFFVDMPVDEEAFSENPPAHDYTSDRQIEVIGVDRASSIVHIPLVHPLVSKSKRQPRLNEVGRKRGRAQVSHNQKSSAVHRNRRQASQGSSDDDRKTPIAIISLMSTTVPYPLQLSSSLKILAPHLATSLYNARQHTNLEKQLAGVSRRQYNPNQIMYLRDPNQRRDMNSSEVFSPPSTESVTSASEYSGTPMHSPRGSSVGTPGWDTAGQGPHDEPSRPLGETTNETNDNYFGPRRRYTSRRTPSMTVMSSLFTNVLTVETPYSGNADMVHDSLMRNDQQVMDPLRISTFAPQRSNRRAIKPMATTSDDVKISTLVPLERSEDISSAKRDASPSLRQTEVSDSPRRQAIFQASGHANERLQQHHKQLHTHGANFISTNPSLPTATAKLPSATPNNEISQREEDFTFPPPSTSMMRIMIDTGAVQEFMAEPKTGNICWANSRFQTYRNESAAQIRKKPWDAIHQQDQRSFLKLWAKALHIGDQISHQVRLKRFDGQYRWFHIRIVPIQDSYSTIKHWHGQAMDIHDQHTAEVDAAREKEKAKSESKYRSLANSNPHIIFAASVPNGMTFTNTQWLSYSGQTFDDALGFGFLEHVHPDDILKCQFPAFHGSDLRPYHGDRTSSSTETSDLSASTDDTIKPPESISDETPGSTRVLAPSGLLRNLASKGVIKASKDGQGRLSITTEMRLKSKFGQYRWHLVQGSLIEESVNFGTGEAQWIIACADISDQKGHEKKLKDANITLELETTRKMQFLSTMSHEIRTPLNGIIGNLQFLLNSNLDEYQSEWTYGADAAARGMHDLINDILDVSKAEAKMLTLYYDWFHVRSIIEDVFETLASKSNEKRLELCYSVEPEVPSNLKGDAGRIRQVLLNLVSNAIKFTQRGEIFVECMVKKDNNDEIDPLTNPDEINLQFTVQDTGSGFTEDEAKMLFRPYSQIDNSSTRHNGGTGLGLLLCKQMVELHHGEISAFSTPGKGSTFTFSSRFRLPTDTDRPKLAHHDSSENSSSSSYVRGKKHVFSRGLVTSPGEISLKADTLGSSGSSDPSVASSIRAAHMSLKSPASSIDSQDSFGFVELTLPTNEASTDMGSLGENLSTNLGLEIIHPPMYSILIVCPQEHTRRTTEAHIKQILPQSIPALVTNSDSIIATHSLFSGEEPIHFTHVVLQLNDATHVLAFMDLIQRSKSHQQTCIVVITDQAQQGEIMTGTPESEYTQLVASRQIQFILKPAKPPKFAKIFDPKQERALSKDHVRANAVEVVGIQKQAYKKFGELLGNRGLRVLAVEDNKLNMKVCQAPYRQSSEQHTKSAQMLTHFLRKMCCMDVVEAWDGEDCTKLVFSHDPFYYSVIIVCISSLNIFLFLLYLLLTTFMQCDIQMPNKDGYETCREIRAWEKQNDYPHIPIIALSANIMAEGQRDSAAAGFTQYTTKPVEWRILGNLLVELVDPNIPHVFLSDRLANECC